MNNIFHIPFTVNSEIEIKKTGDKRFQYKNKDIIIVDGILIDNKYPRLNYISKTNPLEDLEDLYDPFRLFDE